MKMLLVLAAVAVSSILVLPTVAQAVVPVGVELRA